MANERAIQTAQQIAIAREFGAAETSRRMPQQILPVAIEREYGSQMIRRIILPAWDELAPVLDALPRLADSAAAERADSGEGGVIARLMAEARARFARAVSLADMSALARTFSQRTSTHQRIQLSRQVRATFGVDVFTGENGIAAHLDGWVSANTGLIGDLQPEMYKRVEGVINRGFQNGTLRTELTKQVQEELGISRARARVIARDQTGKLYGQVNRTRQKNMGVTHYVWNDVGDRRVRATHAANHGDRFAWDNPPATGHPGHEVQCRCYGDPDFSPILGQL